MILKDCPFCGGPAKIVTNVSGKGYFYTGVKCSVCHAAGRPYRSEHNPIMQGPDCLEYRAAAAAWNMRVKTDE